MSERGTIVDDCASCSRRRFLAGAGMALAAGCIGAGESPAAGGGAPGEPHEAAWYERMAGGNVRCALCPRNCVVTPGKRGYCGVRENRGGTYYTLVYGRPVTVNLDPIEKKPFYHVYPGTKAFSFATVGCNIDCKFCQNWEISQASPDDVAVPFRSPAEMAQAAAQSGAKTMAYTYSEPTISYEYMADCARAGKDLGLDSIVISNGFIADAPQKALFPLVKAIKVDLKSFSQRFYGDMCSGFLQPVLDTLKRVHEAGVWLEIVVLMIPTLNDDPDELKRMAAWIVKELGPDVPVIFSRYHPAYKVRNIPPTPMETLSRARSIALAEGCRFAYGGNVPGMKECNTYCPKCGNVVVDRYGFTILSNSNGKCTGCGTQIPGVWN